MYEAESNTDSSLSLDTSPDFSSSKIGYYVQSLFKAKTDTSAKSIWVFDTSAYIRTLDKWIYTSKIAEEKSKLSKAWLANNFIDMTRPDYSNLVGLWSKSDLFSWDEKPDFQKFEWILWKPFGSIEAKKYIDVDQHFSPDISVATPESRLSVLGKMIRRVVEDIKENKYIRALDRLDIVNDKVRELLVCKEFEEKQLLTLDKVLGSLESCKHVIYSGIMNNKTEVVQEFNISEILEGLSKTLDSYANFDEMREKMLQEWGGKSS